jgi:hypothetical protein
LGAGFSRPAGIPLADELLDLVLDELQGLSLNGETHLHRSLAGYRDYVESATGRRPERIDLENFAAYLDHQHAFGMLGSDTWSEEGNRDQFLLRWGIGRVLHLRHPSAEDLPLVYERFAHQLNSGDVVLTFNYDLVLEAALANARKSFRRFPNRFARIGVASSEIDTEAESSEILILKLHGSLDWVNRRPFDRHVEYMRELQGASGEDYARRHDPLFGTDPISPTTSLPADPQPTDEPLRDVSVIEDLDAYYGSYQTAFRHPPLVLAPSEAKQLYGSSLRKLWYGISTFGWGWGGITVIGYSLPIADPYSRQVLYRIARGYEIGLKDPDWRLGPMNTIVVVDLRTTVDEIQALRDAYRFLPEKHTTFALDGFNIETLKLFKSRPG